MFTNTEIDIETLPKFEDVELKSIASKYIYILVFNSFLTYLLALVTLLTIKFGFNSTFLSDYFWLSFIGVVLLGIIQLVFVYLNFTTRKYGLREKDIMYSAGYITNKTTTLPFNRVQHIEISRSFLARKLGLSTLRVYSAGESGGDIAIAGLPKQTADKQYAFLMGILNERA